ncbi:hypothetical protein Tco_0551553 [Tanacetum coccineum]
MQTTHVVEEAASLPYNSPLPRVHSLRSDEGSMTLHELTVLCTTLSKKVKSLESDLKQTKLTYGAAFIKLIMKVKRLEKEVKLNKERRRAKIVVSNDEDAEKDTSKQGRSMIEDIDQDAEVSLVQIDAKDQGSAAKILEDVARVHTYSRRRRTVSTGSGGISTTVESVSTASALMPVSTAGMDQGSIPLPIASKDKVESLESDLKQTKLTYGAAFTKLIMKGWSMTEDIDQDAGASLVQNDVEDQGRFKDETDTHVSAHGEILADVARVHTYSSRRRIVSTGSGGINTAEDFVSTAGASMPVSTTSMDQGSIPSPIATKDKESQRIAGDVEVAQRLQEEIDASERQRMAQVHQAAQGFTDAKWDDILARVVADEDLVQQLQAGEKYSEKDLPIKLVELVNQRKKFFAQQRAKVKRNKPMTPAQQKAYMSTYIKNQEGDSEVVKDGKKGKAEDSRKKTVARKRIGEKLDDESVKRQKLEDDAKKEALRAYLDIILRDYEAVNVESLATKYPIVDWKTHVLSEDKMYYEIIRANGSTKSYKIFTEMLDDFDRQDVLDLYRLVKERFEIASPKGYDRLLWGDLITVFEPSKDDEVWKAQQDYTLISWRLFDSCEIHVLLINTGIAIHMLVEKTYPLTQEMLSRMLNLNTVEDLRLPEEDNDYMKIKTCEEICMDLFKDTRKYDTIDPQNEIARQTNPLLDKRRLIKRWHVCKPVQVFYDDKSGEDCEMWPTCDPNSSFCYGYKEVFGKSKHGMLRQWILDSFDVEEEYAKEIGNPYSQRFDEYKRMFNNEVEQLSNEYTLKIGRKGFQYLGGNIQDQLDP